MGNVEDTYCDSSFFTARQVEKKLVVHFFCPTFLSSGHENFCGICKTLLSLKVLWSHQLTSFSVHCISSKS